MRDAAGRPCEEEDDDDGYEWMWCCARVVMLSPFRRPSESEDIEGNKLEIYPSQCEITA